MNAAQQYLTDLVHAWAAGRPAGPPLPPLVEPPVIWESLRSHNVEACLGPLLPATARPGDFAGQVQSARRRTDLLLLECERIWPLVGSRGRPPVLLKGAALALDVYPRPADRWFLDLDLLVPRAEVGPVCERLEAAGYRPLKGGRDPLYYEKHHLHRILLGPQGAVVEVHWDLTLPRSVYRLDLEAVFDRAGVRTLGRQMVSCAAPVDQLLHGTYQHIADGYVDLRRILDQVLLTRGLSASEWATLVEESRNSGLDRALWLSLHIMKQISGHAAPPAVMKDLDPGPALRRTLRGLAVAEGCLARRAVRTEGYTSLLHLLLTPTLSLRLQETLRAVWVGEEALLDQGYPADSLPGLGRRTGMGVRRVRGLVWGAARALRALTTG